MRNDVWIAHVALETEEYPTVGYDGRLRYSKRDDAQGRLTIEVRGGVAALQQIMDNMLKQYEQPVQYNPRRLPEKT